MPQEPAAWGRRCRQAGRATEAGARARRQRPSAERQGAAARRRPSPRRTPRAPRRARKDGVRSRTPRSGSPLPPRPRLLPVCPSDVDRNSGTGFKGFKRFGASDTLFDVAFTTLIDTEALAIHLQDPVFAIVDCRYSLESETWGLNEYGKHHIPGAVFASI